MESTENKARVRHQEISQCKTKVLIDRIDEEKKLKVIEYLRDLNLEPQAGEDPLISLDVSTLESKQVCENIVSFMQTLGVDNVTVSGNQYDEKAPEISESDTINDYTLVNSEDIEELAKRIEQGQESEFELIVSSPERQERYRSTEVYRNILKASRNSLQRVKSEHEGLQSATPTTAMKSENWWTRKKKKVWALLKKKQNPRIVHRAEISQPLNISALKRLNYLGGFIRSSKSKLIYKTKTTGKKQNNITNTKRKVLHNTIKPSDTKAKTVLTMEAYTQTNRVIKSMNAKCQTYTKRKIRDKESRSVATGSTTCCGCSNSQCTSIPNIQPRYINLNRTVNNPYVCHPNLKAQPVWYMLPPNIFQHQGNFALEEGMVRESCNAYTEMTTSTMTNTSFSTGSGVFRQRKKLLKERFQPKPRKHGISNSPTSSQHWLSDLTGTESFPTDSSVCKRSKITTHLRLDRGKNSIIHSVTKISGEGDRLVNKPESKLEDHLEIEKKLSEINRKIELISIKPNQIDAAVDCCEFNIQENHVKTVDVGVECVGLDESIRKPEESFSKDSLINTNKSSSEEESKHSNSLTTSSRESEESMGHNYSFVTIVKRPYKRPNKNTRGTKMRRGERGRISKSMVVDEKYAYQDSGLVVPLMSWQQQSLQPLPFLASESEKSKNRSSPSNFNKLCGIFSGRKKSLKAQLLKQKIDLMEMKTILTNLNDNLEKRACSNSFVLKDGDVDEYNEEAVENTTDDSEDEEIQFSITRPKTKKKRVTFRLPLTDWQ